MKPRSLLFATLPLCHFATSSPAQPVPYDIVYVRQARFGDQTNTTWPEVFHPARIDPGADLVLLHPDGSEEVLVAGGNGAVTDPTVSFDAQWVYYARFPDVRSTSLNHQRDELPNAGADIFRINLASRQIQQLTHAEFTPNLGAGNWLESNPLNPPSQYNRLGYGILNLAPCPLPGHRLAFTSNRNGFIPPKGYTNPTLQLFVMDDDGSNVTAIAPMTIGSALHPTVLQDGRIMFSTFETQGLRDSRLWGIWSIWPDGRLWNPIISAFKDAQAFHFMTQLSGGDIIIEDYYNLNNNGFGALYRIPLNPPAGQPRFFPAFVNQNPAIQQTVGQGFSYPFRMSFTPRGMYSITPFTHAGDEAAPYNQQWQGGQMRVGKFTHPSGAPNGDLLVVWSPGPCNDLDRPTQVPRYDAGLYLIRNANIVNSPADLVLLKNDPNYNEAWPRAVVPYSAIHAVPEPANLPWLPNDGSASPHLPAGTPFGLVGTSSLYKRESFPGFVPSWADYFNGLDAFNTSENGQSSNWFTQGADAGRYTNADVWAVRLVALEPNTHRSYGPHEGRHFDNFAAERMRILGEIPVRKFNPDGSPLLDPEGNPDTSFLVKVPADTPFTFQTLDRDGLVLNMAQTWHQVRPGEIRNNCGGCHAHSQQPLDFNSTAAAQANYQLFDLSTITPMLTRNAAGDPDLRLEPVAAVNVEFLRDIRPILQSRCVSCHTQSNPTPPGNLVLDDLALYSGLPGDYKRLADDSAAQWGYPPVIPNHSWRQSNASRYIRAFQSRRSLLTWKVFGRRLDGWTNADHPTESTPGNPATLPPGTDPNTADLDFTGTIMPPPNSGVTPLTTDEQMLIARWIDLGCPINTGSLGNGANANYGWFLDDQRPALTVSAPRFGINTTPLTQLRIGFADAYSGINAASLSIRADFPVAGRAPNTELADLASPAGQGIVTIPLSPPITTLAAGRLQAQIADNQGNVTRADVRFSIHAACPCDFDTSGALSSQDFFDFLTAFFTDDPRADINMNGSVNSQDFFDFLTCFFTGCT